MWGSGGYNVSREVLLAVRQGNQQRVEHLVEGLVAALRGHTQRTGGNIALPVQADETALGALGATQSSSHTESTAPTSRSTGPGDFLKDGAPGASVALTSAGGAQGGSGSALAAAAAAGWGPNVKLGTSVWDFVCAVQRLSQYDSLGEHGDALWDEVTGFALAYAGTMDQRELAVICNAFGAGAPERLHGPLHDALARRAADLASELSAKDLTMIMHGLSCGRAHRRSRCHHGAPGTSADQGCDPQALRALAWATKKVSLEEERPEQAALLLSAFAKMQHTKDIHLYRRMVSFARKTLRGWDSQSLSLFCNAFAASGLRTRSSIGAAAWTDIANRCSEVIFDARPQHLSCMAHGLSRTGISQLAVAGFFRSLSERLSAQPRLSERLSDQDFALLVHSFAKHAQDRGSTPELPFPDGRTNEPPLQLVAAWPLEEQASRRIRSLTPQGQVLVFDACVQLQRGSPELLKTLMREIQRCRRELLAPSLVMLCRATAASTAMVGEQAASRLLKSLVREMWIQLPNCTGAQLLIIAEALADASERMEQAPLWSGGHEAAGFLEAVCRRALVLGFPGQAFGGILKQSLQRLLHHQQLREARLSELVHRLGADVDGHPDAVEAEDVTAPSIAPSAVVP